MIKKAKQNRQLLLLSVNVGGNWTNIGTGGKKILSAANEAFGKFKILGSFLLLCLFSCRKGLGEIGKKGKQGEKLSSAKDAFSKVHRL